MKKAKKVLSLLLAFALVLCLCACGNTEPEPEEEPGPGFEVSDYTFKSSKKLDDHFEKHGIDMGFETKEDYVYAANLVISNPESLHKYEKEDGDDVFYLEATNEFVVLSTEGYIRTYFCPDSGKKYYDKQ